MEGLYESIKEDPVQCREAAKRLFLSPDPTVAEQNLGIKCLTRAVKLEDPEAIWLMGKLFLAHKLRPLQGDPEKVGKEMVEKAIAAGFIPND